MLTLTSSKIKQLEPSTTSSLKNLAAKLKAEGKDIISLVIGEPEFDTPAKIKEAAFKSLNDGFTHYVPTSGIPVLQERIAEKLLNENDVRVNPATEIIVTPGTKFAIFASLTTFLNPGDEVLILEPCYVSYKPLVQLAGGIPITVPLDFENNYTITRDKLEAYITPKTKMIILNSPNNPTGRVFTDKELDCLVRLISDHDLLAISDEVYEYIIYDNNKNVSLASFSEVKDKIITVNGFSKGFAMTGWRIGYIAAHEELIKEIVKVQAHVASCTTSFVQAAAIHAYDSIDEVESMVDEYTKRRQWLIPELNKIPGFTCHYPEGTFFAFVHVKHKGMKSEEISKYIFEKSGVMVTPGKAFGKNGDEFIRISFAASMEELEKAVARIRSIF